MDRFSILHKTVQQLLPKKSIESNQTDSYLSGNDRYLVFNAQFKS